MAATFLATTRQRSEGDDMGLIASVLGPLFERKIALSATVPTWENHVPQLQRENYYRFALEGYSRNEVVYACVEELSTSAAEPRIAAYKRVHGKLEKLDEHPVVDLLERPNPFMDGYLLWATVLMHLSIAGNAYIELVRSASGQVVELWVLRPDRMFVIPDRQRFIAGWNYRLGALEDFIDARDVIHIKMRNPLDDYYGMPPLAACAERVDTDNFMRSFTASFFRNAGVPAGILSINKKVNTAEKEMIQNRFRTETGAGRWHSLLVLEQVEADFKAMGMGLGERGLVLPELDEIDESRIAMVFGVPLELIGARLSMIHGNRSTTREARAGFWDETLMPIYRMIASKLTAQLVPEFSAIENLDEIAFDMSTVAALQEDQDAKHTRVRGDLAAGILSVQEARQELGKDADFDEGAILLIPQNIVPTSKAELEAAGEASPVDAGTGSRVNPAANGRANGGTNGNGNVPTERDQFDALFPAFAGQN